MKNRINKVSLMTISLLIIVIGIFSYIFYLFILPTLFTSSYSIVYDNNTSQFVFRDDRKNVILEPSVHSSLSSKKYLYILTKDYFIVSNKHSRELTYYYLTAEAKANMEKRPLYHKYPIKLIDINDLIDKSRQEVNDSGTNSNIYNLLAAGFIDRNSEEFSNNIYKYIYSYYLVLRNVEKEIDKNINYDKPIKNIYRETKINQYIYKHSYSNQKSF